MDQIRRAMKMIRRSMKITRFALLATGLAALAGAAEKYDLVVYGGTAGGIVTAVSGARQGLKVVLLEPGSHLGGMVSGGLSLTDFGKKEAIGGYALEFYRRAGRTTASGALVTMSPGITSPTWRSRSSTRCWRRRR